MREMSIPDNICSSWKICTNIFSVSLYSKAVSLFFGKQSSVVSFYYLRKTSFSYFVFFQYLQKVGAKQCYQEARC